MMGSRRRLAPLTEGPSDQDDPLDHAPYASSYLKKKQSSSRSWMEWLKEQLPLLSHKKSNLKILLAVLGCPLSPLPLTQRKTSAVVAQVNSSAQYIIRQFEAASGCKRAEEAVKNMYVMGKVKMVMVQVECGANSSYTLSSSLSGSGGGVVEEGCFVIWQMAPEKWLMELDVGTHKVVAGSDGKIAWRHTPWLPSHAAKGGVRPLRRILQGLDPFTVASTFLGADYVGEKQISDEDCFMLKLAVDREALVERSDSAAEIIKHNLVGYMSQRSGLLVHLEDSYLTRIQPPGSQATYWETTIASSIGDYRAIEGIMVAHSGHSSVTITRFGDGVKVGGATTRMEEAWAIEDLVFNVPGLSVDCFIPPAEVHKESLPDITS
ncbi:uncharacterized protein LOC18432619 [Amborella trichopoda]|uniref:Uncharacterized protein n=1 Tax=Amborella trichopoda TaxID=13333 RepID=W1P953_AMBTC|nr:uncharacterized protein LOC18432619 [Amborella trichopoda]ERN04458.1 hypothetical protein AMTR_s00133p00115060 [Amborella trichopoda]|eukprot:XP_006842783.3 uncharacterized protein LOC18432619 [Amborella trichopoda]